ncbi:MAG: sugar nucleotide-binding protein, partial [Pseudomonadota bacterium]
VAPREIRRLQSMNIIGTGLSGLVGSRVVEILASKHTFLNLSLETGVDITNHKMVYEKVAQSDAPWVLHFAAYTDVQGAENERNLKVDSLAWKVNVLATQHIADVCMTLGKHMMYLDTDYAFAGEKKRYTEEDAPDPKGWYATTKTEGANAVGALGDKGLVLRISNPYRANPVGKKDFVHKMLERLQQNLGIAAPTDQLFVPTFIDDIANAISLLLDQSSYGIYHVVGSTSLSPFDAAKTVARVFDCDQGQITATTFAQYFLGRSPIPQYAELSNDKIQKLGVVMRSFTEGLAEVKRQEAVT